MAKHNWVDYNELKAKAHMEEILVHYGLLDTLTHKHENLVGPCPIHKGSNNTQFHVSLSKNVYNCFGNCHGGGNVIDFVCAMEGLDRTKPQDFRKAALLIQEWILGGSEIPATHKPRKEPRYLAKEEPPQVKERLVNEGLASWPVLSASGGVPSGKEGKRAPGTQSADSIETKNNAKEPEKGSDQVINPPLKFALKNLEPDHPYVSGRGLEKLTAQFFGLGFCSKGMMAGRIAIPIHNPAGELVAYIGRWPGEPPEGEPKYRLPAGFRKSLVLFNFHRAREFAPAQGLILVEGLFDCMKVWQAGFQNVVALLGSALSEEQETLIVDAVRPSGKVSLMLDEDAAGWACRDEVLVRLAPKAYVKIIRLGGEGLQPDSLPEGRIKELLE